MKITMDLVTFQYQAGKGWSIDNFPALDSEMTLILVFCAPEFSNQPAPIQELVKKYPKSKIMGCSSAGEIAGTRVLDHSLSVAVIRFQHTPIVSAMTTLENMDDSQAAGIRIAKQLVKPDLQGILILSVGLNINGSELVKGINSVKPANTIVTGGLAGDNARFQHTWVMLNGEIHSNAVVAIGLYGNNIHIGHASKGGWDTFGIERTVTKSDNNILYELDNKPALALYKEYLGDLSSELPSSGLLFPLSIRKNEKGANRLVRTILAVDEQKQSLTFAGDIPTGYLAQLMHANFDRLVTGAQEAGMLVNNQLQEQPTVEPILCIAISCVGRRLVLSERIEEEVESTLAILPKKTQQIGFYSYGELSPFTTGLCELHNQTMTLTTLYES